MPGWSSKRSIRWLVGALALLAGRADAAAAQSIFERLGLDRLRLRGIAVAGGAIVPARVENTTVWGIRADYGEIHPRWELSFGVSYWESEFEREVVERFVAQLRESITDPAGDDTIRVSAVRIADIALELETRWHPLRRSRFVQPYLGGGIGAHVVNAESPLIEDTFVESALDNIAAGLTGLAGATLVPSQRVSVGVEARYTLLSNIRYAVIRALASYRFDLPPSTGRP